MDLLHNPLADMGSAAFLIAYAIFAIGAIAAIRLQIASSDRSRGLPVLPVAADRDPAEIAYLRGGSKELLRFTIFDLVRDGQLRVSDGAAVSGKGKKMPETLEATHAVSALPEDPAKSLETAVVAFFAAPRDAREVFSSDLPTIAETFGNDRYRSNLDRDGLLVDDRMRDSARRSAAYAAIGLLLLAAYRICEALAKGHRNVGFIVLEFAVAMVAIGLAARTGRLSARGVGLMTRLRTALLPMRPTAAAAGAGVLPIFVAATGIGALAGTDYAPINRMFARGASSSGSSCGSCSSGSSDSGGSSGGGGGCGGGCGG